MAESAGLIESLKRLARTLLVIFTTRLELLSNELEEERLRLTQIALYGVVALFCFGLSILLVTVFVVVLFWDSNRLLVLGSLAGLFFLAGVVLSNILRRLTREKSKLFSSSLAELTTDHEALSPRSENHDA